MEANDSDSSSPMDGSIVFGRARFTLLSPRVLRLEYAEDGKFEERPSLTIPRRPRDVVDYSVEIVGPSLRVDTALFTLFHVDDGRNFSSDTTRVEMRFAEGGSAEWRPWAEEWGDLGGAVRTLDGCNGRIHKHRYEDPEGQPLPIPPGLLSRRGWTLYDDSKTLVLENGWPAPRSPGDRCDLYLFMYGEEYLRALADAQELFGRQPIPPRFAFGYWWSRYWAYTDDEIESLLDEMGALGLPIDVLLLDMDWHEEGWTGFTWERSYFPEPRRFLREMRDKGVAVGLNLHPADGVGPDEEGYEPLARALGRSLDGSVVPFDAANRQLMEGYFEHILRPHEEMGVRFWWLDWQQGSTCGIPGLDPLSWLNHLHWEAWRKGHPDERPLSLSRFGGLGGGRYPAGFSGDAYRTWESLAFQPWLTATASNSLFGYWSHDIGGHYFGSLTGELLTRWFQFGVYSPILRTHAGKQEGPERRFWKEPEPYGGIMRALVKKRYELVPYIYSEARACYDSGLSICRSMYYHFPRIEESYRATNQYFFGRSLVVHPVTSPVEEPSASALQRTWLPPGRWFDTAWGDLIESAEPDGVVLERRYRLEEVPVFAVGGSVLPGQVNARRAGRGSVTDLLVVAYPGGSGRYSLYEDDGDSEGYTRGEFGYVDIEREELGGADRITLRGSPSSYRGYSALRSLEIRFVSRPPPNGVEVNGREIGFQGRPDGWRYDGTVASVIVRVEAINLEEGVAVLFHHGSDERLVLSYGVKGLLARAREAFDVARLLEVPWEREVGRVAGTGARIARAPESFSVEALALFRWFLELPGRRDEIVWNLERQGRFQRKNFPSFEKSWAILLEGSEGASTILERSGLDWSELVSLVDPPMQKGPYSRK